MTGECMHSFGPVDVDSGKVEIGDTDAAGKPRSGLKTKPGRMGRSRLLVEFRWAFHAPRAARRHTSLEGSC